MLYEYYRNNLYPIRLIHHMKLHYLHKKFLKKTLVSVLISLHSFECFININPFFFNKDNPVSMAFMQSGKKI